MAVLVSITPNPPKALAPAVINIRGLVASTAYSLHVLGQGGGTVNEIRIPFVSDGSGQFATTLVPQQPGGGAFTLEVHLTTMQVMASLPFVTVGWLMAAVVAAPNPTKGYGTVTLTLSAMTATTAYTVTVISPQGHTTNLQVTTDGSGAATVRYVPSVNGNHSINVYQFVPVSVANTTFNSSGSSS